MIDKKQYIIISILVKDARKCVERVQMNTEKCPKCNGYQYNKKQPRLFFIVAE